MSQELQTWCEKLKREVTEDTPSARRIRLITAGDATVWQVWEPVADLNAEQWAEEAEALLASLKAELPKRRVQLLFVAEDHNGAAIANKPRTVTGVNESAQDLGTQNGAKALADAMASVGRLMDSTLESARKFMAFQSDQLERTHNQLAEAHEIFMAIKKVELESDEQQTAVSKIMVEQLQNGLPLLMKVVEHMVSKPSNTLGSTVAAVANATTNGAKAS
jgi:hypothetical protein